MHVAGYYGAAVVVMLLIVWASQNQVLQKLGLCLLGSWVATQTANALFGLDGTPLLLPSVQGVLCVVVAGLGLRHRSFVALVIFMLYGALIAVHLAAYVAQRTGEYAYFATINLLFLAQLVVVGGAGATGLVSAWLSRRGERAGPVHPRRS